MKYRAGHSFSFLSSLPGEVEIPLRLESDNNVFVISEVDGARRYATGFMEAKIDPPLLSLSAHRETMDGTKLPPRIAVPDALGILQSVSRFIHTLSFLTDIPISSARLLEEDELIPESEEDQALLESFGTTEIHHELAATTRRPDLYKTLPVSFGTCGTF